MKTVLKDYYSKFLFSLILMIFWSCSSTEDPEPVIEENSVYLEITLDGEKYRSEILETNLIPGSGFERKTDNAPGLNIMQYTFYSRVLTMLYATKCGTMENKDCLDTNIWVYEDLKAGSYSYPKVSTHGLSINGEQYRMEYSGPETNPNPPTINFNMQVTKYDEVKQMAEGTISGQLYKYNDPTMKAYILQGKFRVKINKG
ncbi:hypothetical protein [Algoriphagus mannitolivorans]|uniref:hypothetical protein n=1 Tax=Algoriphagus mannitolivorans TaxID=226504 RepID=UPI000478ABAB|nr:hypothetical protein [Algoriphagus mannitolivorans]